MPVLKLFAEGWPVVPHLKLKEVAGFLGNDHYMTFVPKLRRSMLDRIFDQGL